MALHGEHDLSSARGCRRRLALGGPVVLGRAGAWSARREAGVRWIAVQVRPAARWCGAATTEDAGQAVSGGEESADTDAASGAPAAAAAILPTLLATRLLESRSLLMLPVAQPWMLLMIMHAFE